MVIKNKDIIKLSNLDFKVCDYSKLSKWFYDGYIEVGKGNSITETGALFQTMVEQSTNMLCSQLPEYEIDTDNNDIKNLIEDFISKNDKEIYIELLKAVRDYVLFGAGLISFRYKEGRVVFKREDPENIGFDIYNNQFYSKRGKLNDNSKIVKVLGTADVLEIVFNDVKYFVSGNKHEKANNSLIYPFTSIFNVKGDRIVSDFLKIETLLKSNEDLEVKKQGAQRALIVKGLMSTEVSFLVKEIKDNAAVQTILCNQLNNGMIDRFEPFKWVDNSSLIANLQEIEQQMQQNIENMYSILGLAELFMGKDMVNANETVVNAMDRTEKANVLWRARQAKASDFIEDFFNKLIMNVLYINGFDYKIKVHIETSSLTILEQQQKQQQNFAILSQIKGILNETTALGQQGLIDDMKVNKEIASSLLSTSNFKSNVVTAIQDSFDNKISQVMNNLKQVQVQQAMLQQTAMQQQAQAQAVAMQKQAMDMQKTAIDIAKGNLDIKRKQSDLNDDNLDYALKKQEVDKNAIDIEEQKRGIRAFIANVFKNIRSRFTKAKNQSLIEETMDNGR